MVFVPKIEILLVENSRFNDFIMTSIVLYENKQSVPFIWNGQLGDLVDERRLTFFPKEWLDTTKNTIVVGGVQSGKTACIIDLISRILQRGDVPILVASDKKSVLDQYKTRFSNDMIARIKELNSKTNVQVENLNQSIIYTAILSPMRLKKIQELIGYGICNYRKKFVLIIDEGDMSIKDCDCQLEIMQRQMDNLGPYLKRIYITATPFAVLNSKAISPCIEEFTTIPSNYYSSHNLQYRDYFDMYKYSTDLIDTIAHTKEDELTEEIICNFANFLQNELSIKVSPNQPNIGLLKLFHENSKKHTLALKLSSYFQNLAILVYTGEGCTCYYNSQIINVWKNGICISRILQEVKDHNSSCPFLIISYNMAGRAETFKAKDHSWTLTHFFISLPEKSAVDQTVQAMRCNGQYKLSDPIIKVYASQKSHNRLEKLIINNNEYVKRLGENFNHNGWINTRECIEEVTFLKVSHFKFSLRKGVDDVKIKNSDDDGSSYDLDFCKQQANYLVNKNNCSGYEIVTHDQFYITKQQVLDNIKDPDIAQAFKNPGPDAFKFKTVNPQNLLRILIQNKCEEIYSSINGCQIGYYTERSKVLNKLHHTKSEQFKAQAIAEILLNGDICVVVYKEDYYRNPHNYINKVLIWSDTQEKYHLHVNKPDAKYKLMFLTHT
jgi:hypothetical protein